jgi:hypothetical protein
MMAVTIPVGYVGDYYWWVSWGEVRTNGEVADTLVAGAERWTMGNPGLFPIKREHKLY